MLSKLFRTSRGAREHAGAPVRNESHYAAESIPPPSVVASDLESAAKLASAGHYGESLALIDSSLEAHRDDPAWTFARGSTLFEWGRITEARAWFLKAVALGHSDPLLFLRLGWSCIWATGARSGEEWMRRTIQMVPDDWLGHFGLGASLRGQDRIDEAVACFERALELSADNVHCLAHLFDCRYSQGRLPEAEALAKRCIATDPVNPRGWTNLGIALIAQDRFDDATDAFEHAESMGPGNGEVDQHLNAGICLRDVGRLPEALELYERALPTRPSVGAHAHYGHALLTAGQLRKGLLYYEFRWMQEPLLSLRPTFRKPVWSGQDLDGKTVLLRSEQGVGDVIQFIRFAPHLKALGATVLLQLRKNIGELAKSFPGVDRIIDPGEPYPEFDYYIHLMSLPRVLGIDIGSIPASVPYLEAEPARIVEWKDRLPGSDSMNVGIVWAGDPGHLRDRYRSIPLRSLAPLASVPGVRFFSLQKGPQAAQIEAAPPGMAITDLGPDLRDYADTAAVVSQLDLLICVDTSVAHLAGALGKPAWVLVPTPADWRWLESREDSPWYPTMRLFRQVRQGDWDEVLVRLKSALQQFVEDRRAGSPRPRAGEPFRASTLRPVAADALSLRTGHTAVAETRAGIVQYWPEQPAIGISIEQYGEYLQRHLDLLSRWVMPGATVVEIGAGIGLHALFLASIVGPAGHMFLYEDDVLRKQVLQQNLRANRFGNFTLMKRRLGRRVTVNRAATGDVRATPVASSEFETLDELRLDNLQWIKVNGETDGMVALDGAADTLWRLRPKLFIAVERFEAISALSARAKDFGYQCFRVETPLFNPDNFYRRSVDVFEGRMAHALLAIPEETVVDIPLEHCVEL